MRAVAYVNKFLRAKGRGVGNNFRNLDSLLGLKPILVPPQIFRQVYATAYHRLLTIIW